MHYYHLKLDLYTDNAIASPHSPQSHATQQGDAQSTLSTSSTTQAHSTSSSSTSSRTSSIATQANRLRDVFKPFPHQRHSQAPQSSSSDLSAGVVEPQKDIRLSTAASSTSSPGKSSGILASHPQDYRFGTIDVASLDDTSLAAAKDKTPSIKSRTSKKKMTIAAAAATASSGATAEASSGTGFHNSEPVQGILRLYKDTNEITTGDIHIQSAAQIEESSSSTTIHGRAGSDREGAEIIHPDYGTSVCVLAVPSYMSPGDFLNFVGPVRASVSHFRIIRDAMPNRFMVLMKFRAIEATAEFYKRYNGKAFSSLEPEICHVVYLKSIEIRAGCMPPYAFPFLNDDPFLQNNHPTSPATAGTSGATSAAGTTIQAISSTTDNPPIDADAHSLSHQLSTLSTDHPGLAELPTCPVCLERMDSSVTGLLTILCQHTFHCHCLSRWGEGSCPVCRYSQKGVKKVLRNSARNTATSTTQLGGLTATTDGITEDQNVCAICRTSENLWICLICGHIGCGRYQEKHAYHHYYETSHLYALELETQRVWDYAGDGYVHRLIQNKADGKLVELPSAVDGTLPSQHSVQVGQEKLDAIGLEYTYLLTSQLESQRLYFDAQMAAMAAQLAEVNKEAKEWEKEVALLNQKNRELALMAESLEKEKLPVLIKEKKAAEKRLEKLQERLQLMERQYEEEKEMNVGLRTNQDSFKERLQEKEAQIEDLQEQVRDMMIYLDTQQKIEASSLKDEIVNGTIEIGAAPTPSSTSSPTGGQNRRKSGRK
ncbi:hypothetical protein EDD11_005063 [Mortierella claussenii]|nr:hypothetical protein EDD11_005063 [Mortierella claussenii]